jgi:beta-lactamase superfamily II metal-dependent hydrolase
MLTLSQLFIAVLCLPFGACLLFGQANGKLQIHFMDVGQGDATLLVSPQGETVLFDNGVAGHCPVSYLQQLGTSKIDYHIASHYHADHIGCTTEVFAQFPLQKDALDRGGEYSSATYTEYLSAVGTHRRTAYPGTKLVLDASSNQPVEIEVVAYNGNGVQTTNENDLSVVAVVRFGKFTVELGGDLSGFHTGDYEDIETDVAPLVGQVEVYKIHHHCSQYSTNDTWLRVTKPIVGIVSVGDANGYGHPTEECLERLHAANVKTYWTETGAGATPEPGHDVVAGNVIVEVEPAVDSFTVTHGRTTVDRYAVWGASAACTYAVGTSGLSVAALGGNIGLTIQADAGCPWSIGNLPAWLTVSGSTQGTGPSALTLVAGANAGGARSASLSVGGVSVPVRQLDVAACGGSSSCVLRALPHVAFGGEWTTGLSAISSGTVPGSFSVSFYGNAGTSLALPFKGGLGNLSTLTDTVPAGGLKYYEAENPSVGDLSAWGIVTADESVTAQAIFRRHRADGHFYEAAVPSAGGYSRFVMPFDATTFTPTGAQLFTAFAVVNLDPSATAQIACTARNQSGVLIPNAVSVPALGPLGHYTAFDFPALTGQRGTLDCTANTLIAAIALRAIGGDAFSTLPVIPK